MKKWAKMVRTGCYEEMERGDIRNFNKCGYESLMTGAHKFNDSSLVLNKIKNFEGGGNDRTDNRKGSSSKKKRFPLLCR